MASYGSSDTIEDSYHDEELARISTPSIIKQHENPNSRKSLLIFAALLSILGSILLVSNFKIDDTSISRMFSAIVDSSEALESSTSMTNNMSLFMGADSGMENISMSSDLVNSSSIPMAEISFRFSRCGEYSPLTINDKVLRYEFLQQFDSIIEPYTSMRLVVENYTDPNVYYSYKVCPTLDPDNCEEGFISIDPANGDNVDVTLECKPHDDYVVTVTEFAGDGVMLKVGYGRAICLYVRREVRFFVELGHSMTQCYLIIIFSSFLFLITCFLCIKFYLYSIRFFIDSTIK